MAPATTISEVMTADPIVLSPDATVREAAQAMRDRDVGDVLISGGDGLEGIVTDRDIVVRCIADGADPDSVHLSDVETGSPVSLSPGDPVDRAIEIFRDQAVRRIPVTEEGRVVGIVSIGDLAVDRDRQSALADISASPPNN